MNGSQTAVGDRNTATAEGDPLVRLVRDVAVKVNEASSIQDVMSFALHRLCEYSGWEAAFAFRRESGNGRGVLLRPLAGYYGRDEYAALHDHIMKAAVPVGQDVQLPAADGLISSEDFDRTLPREATEIARKTDLRRVVVVPVPGDGSLELVIKFFSKATSDVPGRIRTGIESVVAQLEHLLRRERAYRLLERQSRQLRAVQRAAADAILTVRADGGIEDMNPAAERLFGVPHDRMTERQVSALLPGLESALPAGRVLETIGAAGGLETEARDAGGRPLPVHLTVSESLSDGENSFYILAVRDFTAVRSAQRREVHQERLAAMGEMMTALAHESRNALQRIQSCLTLLELRGNAEVLSLVDDMQSAQDHLQRLYEEVRSFAAPLHLRVERVNLEALIHEVWQSLSEKWQPGSLGLRLDVQSGGGTIVADEERIVQVIRNVLENAIEASPEEGLVEIAVVREAVAEEPVVTVEIRNRGESIPPDVQQRVFDLLYSSKRNGTGMGLPMARRIVQEHGGEMGVRSHDEEGTVVWVRLPVGDMPSS